MSGNKPPNMFLQFGALFVGVVVGSVAMQGFMRSVGIGGGQNNQ